MNVKFWQTLHVLPFCFYKSQLIIQRYIILSTCVRNSELTSLLLQGLREHQLQQERKNCLVPRVTMPQTVRHSIRRGVVNHRTVILTLGDCTSAS